MTHLNGTSTILPCQFVVAIITTTKKIATAWTLSLWIAACCLDGHCTKDTRTRNTADKQTEKRVWELLVDF
jgi:hypothetical protein